MENHAVKVAVCKVKVLASISYGILKIKNSEKINVMKVINRVVIIF